MQYNEIQNQVHIQNPVGKMSWIPKEPQYQAEFKNKYTFLSSWLYTSCFIFWKRFLIPCSPLQIWLDFVSNAIILWYSSWSLKSSKLSCKPPTLICVRLPLQAFNKHCFLFELIWVSFCFLQPKELWFRYCQCVQL